MTLNFKQYGTTGEPLLILHGLMGSLDNWQSIAKTLAVDYTIYTIDQRNHGKSPHSEDFDYELLAADLLEFMKEQGIGKANLLGHSMGGKTVMHFALLHPEMVNKLIVADIAPSLYEDRHNSVFKALHAVDLSISTSREDVQAIMEKTLHDKSTVLFLMKGLYRDDENHFQWRFNVNSLFEHYDIISDFPEHTETFPGKALFIKGAESDYINAINYSDINRYFPDNEITEIEHAGHWLHADKPVEFSAAVEGFLK